MPCIYDDNGEAAREQHEALNLATRLLCEVTLMLSFVDIASVPGLAKWIRKHRRADQQRKKREAEDAKLAAHKAKKQLAASRRFQKALKEQT